MKVKVIRGWINKSGISNLEENINSFLSSLPEDIDLKFIPCYAEDNLIIVFIFY